MVLIAFNWLPLDRLLCILCSFGRGRFALNTKVSYGKVNYWLLIDLTGKTLLYSFIVHEQIKVENPLHFVLPLYGLSDFSIKSLYFSKWCKWHHSCSKSHNFCPELHHFFSKSHHSLPKCPHKNAYILKANKPFICMMASFYYYDRDP